MARGAAVDFHKHPQNCFVNHTKSCTIGLSPEKQKELWPFRVPDHAPEGKPWTFPSRLPSGADWYVPPGKAWIDTNAVMPVIQTSTQWNSNIFVHCEDEEEFAQLKAMSPNIKEVREGKVLKGFFGPLAVLRDETHRLDDVIANRVEYMHAAEHIQTLKKEAAEKDAALASTRSEVDKIRVEYEKMKQELAALKKK